MGGKLYIDFIIIVKSTGFYNINLNSLSGSTCTKLTRIPNRTEV